MENLFSVILLTAASVILFSLYYGLKGIYRTYQKRHVREKIKSKIYEDEKAYIKNYLRILLNKLKSGELSWILISSRLYPQDKLEITLNPRDYNLLVKTRLRKLSDVEIKILKNLGAISSGYRDEINSLAMPINSKIVTDIVYYCLEIIARQGNTKNIKISTSGGPI